MSPSEGATRTAAWDQFLIGKRDMLAKYRQAVAHSLRLPVKTHHGVAGEAFVREWLETFLPQRFGVTAGHIRGQRLTAASDYRHFDIIVYDRVESPILWIESNPDKSPSGRKRIIPAEHVRAVVEVKAAFNRRAAEEAAVKLDELRDLMAGIDAADERYPTYLPRNTVLVPLFFELRREDRDDISALESCRRTSRLPRVAYGPVILSGEGRPEDDTCVIRQAVSEQAMDGLTLSDGLLSHVFLSRMVQDGRQFTGTTLTWSALHFSDFAFDLLALMNGTYRHGFASSFHGIDFSKFATK
jgi:hypothetical protein